MALTCLWIVSESCFNLVLQQKQRMTTLAKRFIRLAGQQKQLLHPAHDNIFGNAPPAASAILATP